GVNWSCVPVSVLCKARLCLSCLPTSSVVMATTVLSLNWRGTADEELRLVASHPLLEQEDRESSIAEVLIEKAHEIMQARADLGASGLVIRVQMLVRHEGVAIIVEIRLGTSFVHVVGLVVELEAVR